MRLTTRLLELASWLLIRRALKEGEITAEQAEAKRARVKLQTLGRPAHTKGFAELPQGLRGSDRRELHASRSHRPARPRDAPAAGEAPKDAAAINPVATQISTLEQAFAMSPRRRLALRPDAEKRIKAPERKKGPVKPGLFCHGSETPGTAGRNAPRPTSDYSLRKPSNFFLKRDRRPPRSMRR